MAATITPSNVITKDNGQPFDNTGQVLGMPTQERDYANIYLVQNGSEIDRYVFKDGLADDNLTVWGVSSSSVLKYQAIFTQSGTDAPTVTVLNSGEADYLGAISWARGGAGTYNGTKTGAFTENKTVSPQDQTRCVDSSDDGIYVLDVFRTSDNTIRIYTGLEDGTPTDGFLTSKYIEILVFPS